MLDLAPIKARLAATARGLTSYEAAKAHPGLERWADDVRALVEEVERLRKPPVARPLDEWHEDHGAVLWWTLPVVEPPHAGSPLDDDWPGYHTHWTPIECPEKEEGA